MRAMKDSGVEWIGEIPQEWGTIKFKYLHAGMNTGEGIDKEFWSTNETDKIFYTAGLVPIHTTYLDFPEWKFTEENDLLLARNGTPYVYYPEKGACYTDHIIRAKLNKDVNKRFVQYCLQQSISSIVVESVSIATWSASLWNEQLIPYPSLDKQRHIVEYLYSKCSKIDTIIEKQQAVIEKLKEYKLSVITEAVTKGLNPDVEMKDSGVEWIGEIPKHWSVCKIKTLTDVLPGYAFASDDFVTDEGIALLRGINVTPNGVRWDDVVYWKNQYDGLKNFLLKEGDIVLGLDRPWIKEGTRVTTIKQEDLPCLLVQRVCRIRTFENADYRFILHCINSEMFKQSLSIETTGISVPHISTKQIQDFIVAIPSIEEQKSICDYLEKQIALVEKVVANKRNTINKLSEYRKSLIYEVVTGKKEV